MIIVLAVVVDSRSVGVGGWEERGGMGGGGGGGGGRGRVIQTTPNLYTCDLHYNYVGLMVIILLKGYHNKLSLTTHLQQCGLDA